MGWKALPLMCCR
uniref:Uncharacterized protein n=1 Tax=Anguilla anguilla TaxID=7936 RepID=A0A0E9TET6_ANGAN